MQIFLQDEKNKTRFPGTPTAVALGFFDGVHTGHAAVIGAAAALARARGLSAAVVTFRSSPRGSALLMTEEQRREAMAALGAGALVELSFGQVRDLSPEAFVHDILRDGMQAKAVFCGFNYRFGRGAEAGTQELIRLCGRCDIAVQVLPPVCALGGPVSSTRIRALLREGRADEAGALLGRAFAVRAEVIHGRRLGRTLGTPTINQRLPAGLVEPAHGVYASYALVAGKRLPAVTNIGNNPTVGGTSVLCETYIPRFSGDLYGKTVEVSLRKFLRGEVKFDTLDEMKAQIMRDAEDSLALPPMGWEASRQTQRQEETEKTGRPA